MVVLKQGEVSMKKVVLEYSANNRNTQITHKVKITLSDSQEQFQ